MNKHERIKQHEAFLAIGCSLICFKALTRANALC